MQKLATVVVVGLVGLATLMVVYLGYESQRRATKQEEQHEVAIERGIKSYVQFCVLCHGAKGYGFGTAAEGDQPDGRPGWPLNPAAYTTLAQPADGPPTYRDNQSADPTIRVARERVLRTTIHNGRGLMPALGRGNPAGATLNDEQINELVLMMQNVNWDTVYEEVLAANNGVEPTVPPKPTPTTTAGEAEQPALPSYTIVAKDIFFEPKDITVPADVPIRLELPNQGVAAHNFSIDALKISVDEPAGSTESLDFTFPVGTYDFYCNVPGHKDAGMVGTLIADPNAPVPTVAASEQPTADAASEPAATAPTFTIASKDILFEPKELTVPADVPIRLELPNQGAIPHNFSIDALKISVDELAGATESLDFTFPAGTYEYYCNVPGHKDAGMAGTLKAEAGATAPLPATTEQPVAASPATSEQPATAESGGAGEAPAFTITSKDIMFEPKTITVPAEVPVTLELPNQGFVPHNFSIDALGISVDQVPGSTQSLDFTFPAGTYDYYCNVPGHKDAGMVGTLIADPNAPAPPPTTAEQPAATESGTAAEAPTFTVASKDILFEPKTITVPADVPVTLELPNEGFVPHNFSIDALGISVDQAPGSTESLDFTFPAGSYDYYCNVPGHKDAGMVGKLIAEAGAAPAGEPAASPASATPPSAVAAPTDVTITAVDIAFDPITVNLVADTPTTVTLTNTGAIPHNFAIDDLGIDLDLPPGESQEITIDAPAGDYQYYCNVPGHKDAGMVGTLRVH